MWIDKIRGGIYIINIDFHRNLHNHQSPPPQAFLQHFNPYTLANKDMRFIESSNISIVEFVNWICHEKKNEISFV